MDVGAVAWSMVAEQVVTATGYLNYVVLLFPVFFTKMLFIQASLLSVVFFSPGYFMMLVVTVISSAFTQGGLAPIMKWALSHYLSKIVNDRATRKAREKAERRKKLKSEVEAQREEVGEKDPDDWATKSIAASLDAAFILSFGVGTGPSFDKHQNSSSIDGYTKEDIQKSTLEAIIVLHQRGLAVMNFSSLAAYVAMLAAVAGETIAFQLLGKPECCELATIDTNSTSSMRPPCPDRPGWILKNDLRDRCPRITGKFKEHHRQLMMMHFLISIACVFLTWILGQTLLNILMKWARSKSQRLESPEERAVSLRPSDSFTELHLYLSQYKDYLLCIMAWTIIAVFSAIRNLHYTEDA
eukprot:gnl/TRDRNA2_/TRDRNA2_146814_c3_seq1.p1 gnl/TRDRNA2_/TRDRNA2_146814_c3~~gnl/TRDRNA2_/TRDRNA2_146814_c3_seq1.p1  ORF type:complete len:385 (+),score=59.32 gnl/TRDRNA2_/TRDRNA2_146814_c3_seq1:92-1156(+)